MWVDVVGTVSRVKSTLKVFFDFKDLMRLFKTKAVSSIVKTHCINVGL